MRPGKRLSPHLLPGVALVLIALAVLVHPELDRPWLSLAPPSPGPGATPTATLPPALGAPADVLTEAALTVRDAGAGHGPYADRYAAGELPHLSGGAGATYYIATTGVDAGNSTCSLAAPCASLTHFGVLQGGPTVLPGATIDILPGQYNLAYTGVTTPTISTVGLWDWNGVAGTAAQPITIQGIGPVTITRETPATLWDQQVRLLSIRQQGGGAPQLPSYVTFANITFVGMTARADYIPTAMQTLDPGGNTDNTGGSEIEYYVSISPVGDIFDHITVRDSAIGCIKGNAGPTVQYSLLLNCGKGNFSHAVYASGGNWTLTHNVVQNGAGASLYTDDITAGHVMTITDNVVSQQAVSITVTGSAGIQTSEGGSIVARNVVYDSWCGAINIGHSLPNSIDAAHPITVEQNVIANWNVSQASNCTALSYAAPGYETVRNNSFWGRGFYTGANGTPNGPMIQENNIFAAGAAPNYPCYIGFAGSVEDYNLFYNSVLNPVCSTTQGPHDINGGASTNPLYWAAPYVPPGSMNPFVPLPDLHLQAASPARGAGIDVGYGTDLGAYPYDVSYAGTSTPLPTSTPYPTPFAPLPTAPPSTSGGAARDPHTGHRR